MEAVHADVRNIFSQPIKNKLDVCDVLADLNFYLFARKHQGTAAFPMLRGSLYHMCNIFYDCMSQIRDTQRAMEYARQGSTSSWVPARRPRGHRNHPRGSAQASRGPEPLLQANNKTMLGI